MLHLLHAREFSKVVAYDGKLNVVEGFNKRGETLEVEEYDADAQVWKGRGAVVPLP